MKKLFRILLAVTFAFGVLQFMAMPVMAADTLRIQSGAWGSSAWQLVSGATTNYHNSQTFIPASNLNINTVKIGLVITAGSPSGTATLGIYLADGSHHPTGSALATGTVPYSGLPAFPSEVLQVFTLSNTVPVLGGTEYCMVLSGTQTDAGEEIKINKGDGYASGTWYYSTSPFTSWTDYGHDFDFEIWGNREPLVETTAASSVTTTTAVLNGAIFEMGEYSTANVTFEYGETTGYGTETSPADIVTTASVVGKSITSLAGNTTYHYRMKMVTIGATTYGDDVEFTTTGAAPVVNTENATSITWSSAILNGNLTILGDYAEVLAGMRIRENGTTVYSNYYPDYPEMTEIGAYNVTVSGLIANTTYDVGAFALYNDATQVAYGDVEQFDTLDYDETPLPPTDPPVVSTDSFTVVDTTSVTLRGTLSDLGTADSVAVGFYFGTGNPPEYFFTAYYSPMTETGEFTVTLGGLTPGVTYYYQAKATGDAIAYGEIKTCGTTDTTADDPIVVTLPASSIANTTAVLNGELIQVGNHTPVNLWFNIRPAGTEAWHTVTPLVEQSELGAYNMTANSTTVGFGIMPNTWYEYQAVVTNGYWRSDHTIAGYGDIQTFLTNDQVTPPTFVFTLNPASGITKSTAILSGQLAGVDANATATVNFDYGIGTTTVNTYPASRIGPGPVSYTASSLTPDTTYWYKVRVYVGDSYWVSPERTFRTLTEAGTTPGITPTPTITPPGGTGSTDPWDWLLTSIGHYFLLIIGMIIILMVAVFVGGKKFGAPIGGLIDVIAFGAAWQANWVDKTVMIFGGVIIGYIVWRAFFSSKGAV